MTLTQHTQVAPASSHQVQNSKGPQLSMISSSGKNSQPPPNDSQDHEPPTKIARKDSFFDESKPNNNLSEIRSPNKSQNPKAAPSLSNSKPTGDITSDARVKADPCARQDITTNAPDIKATTDTKKEEDSQMSSKDVMASNNNQPPSNNLSVENPTSVVKQEPLSNASISTPMSNQRDDSRGNVNTSFNSISSQYGSNRNNRSVQKKTFKPEELRQALMPVLEKLNIYNPESLPFRQPVDPELLQIPDYYTIIKKPMDLSTIKRKLDTGVYSDPWQYVDDVRLMFDNAWLYNKKNSKVYKFATKLSEIFDSLIDPVMVSLGYCCGRKYDFQPQVLLCFGKELCQIPRDAKYMNYMDR